MTRLAFGKHGVSMFLINRHLAIRYGPNEGCKRDEGYQEA